MTQERTELSPAAKREVLECARAGLRAAFVAAVPQARPLASGGVLAQRRGCFVTLRNRRGELRGCVGTFESSEPLGATIFEMAGSATRDSRFQRNPVTAEELDNLVLSVRILSSLTAIDDPLHLRRGSEGIYIVDRRANKRGCFLPEVAVEQQWDVPTLLGECCRQKMGLQPDAWRAPTHLEFFTFSAIGVKEPDIADGASEGSAG